MSAASGEATNKMAEFQSGQYKLWHGQLMAQLYPWRAKEMWSEVNDCQSVKKINLILILGLADQDGPCVNVLPTHWEENFHLCPCHLCGGNWLRERFWQVRLSKFCLDGKWNFLQVANKMILDFSSFADYLWESHNKGKLWKDIRVKYESSEEEEAWIQR